MSVVKAKRDWSTLEQKEVLVFATVSDISWLPDRC